jgi:hypothetical protein
MDHQSTPSLNDLFDFAEPGSLRRSLNHVFFDFLINNKDCLPADFETITGDFYVLIRFLDRVEQDQKNDQALR